MAETYGYARCSTDDSRQDISRQKRDLLAPGIRERCQAQSLRAGESDEVRGIIGYIEIRHVGRDFQRCSV